MAQPERLPAQHQTDSGELGCGRRHEAGRYRGGLTSLQWSRIQCCFMGHRQRRAPSCFTKAIAAFRLMAERLLAARG